MSTPTGKKVMISYALEDNAFVLPLADALAPITTSGLIATR
jgi:hypothetical protein